MHLFIQAYCMKHLLLMAFQVNLWLTLMKICLYFDVKILTNSDVLNSIHSGKDGRKIYNLLHITALYNINHSIYLMTLINNNLYFYFNNKKYKK